MIVVLLGAASCTRHSAFAPTLPRPTKDDLLLVNGLPLSLTGFASVRNQMKLQDKNNVLWVGTASLGLMSAANKQGKEIAEPDAIAVARYAIGDLTTSEVASALQTAGFSANDGAREIKARLEDLLAHAIIQKNIPVLAAIH